MLISYHFSLGYSPNRELTVLLPYWDEDKISQIVHNDFESMGQWKFPSLEISVRLIELEWEFKGYIIEFLENQSLSISNNEGPVIFF